MAFLETVFYFIVTLGVLVLVHELGHFLAAKLCGMRVERFSIGFPPRAFGKVIGETDYCISYVPIGGYVKISGMIDESFDNEHLGRDVQPWEFRAKPIWQRMFVISAGVIMNLLLAVAIFWGVNYSKGKIIRETTEIGYVVPESPAEKAGLQSLDRILTVNGQAVTHWEDVLNHIYVESVGNDLVFTVQRGSGQTELSLPRSDIPDPNEVSFGILPSSTTVIIESVEPGRPADKAGLQPGDAFVTIAGDTIRNSQQVISIISGHAGESLEIAVMRKGDRVLCTATPSEDGRIGVSIALRYDGPEKHLSYGLFEALPVSLRDIAWVTTRSVEQIWLMIIGDVPFSKNVGGPIKIAQFATQSAEMGVTAFLGFMAVLSISLAILNILPFPALDGGHLMFLLYEAIFRRTIPAPVMIAFQRAGFALLLAFMAYVVFNDIINL
jgi:regulator of sigma E protease